MLSAIGTVFQKEVVDALRDRKALMTILISPALTLALIYGIIHFVVFLQEDSREFTLAVEGQEYAAPLMAWLNERGINIKDAPKDGVDAVRNHSLDLLLIVPKELPEKIAALETAEVELVYDQSRKDLQGKIANIKITVQQWSATIGALRLVARGVSPQVMNPLRVLDTDVSEQRSGAMLFGMIAMIITIMVFTSSVGVSVDMMAGERERKSLEPLLLSPVSRMSVLLGKWLTASLVTLTVVILINVALYLIIPTLPLDQLGIRFQLRLSDAIYLTLLALPLIFLSTIFQLFVSIFSKSFKEAQSYIALLMIIPILVGYYVIWSDVPLAWHYWVPVMGSQTLMEDILSKGYSDFAHYVANIVSSLGIALVLAIVTVKQLQREKIIYG